MYQKYSTINLNGEFFDKGKIIDFIKNNSKLSSWEKDIYEFTLEWLDEKNTIQAQTSGTTGKPKTIFLQKDKMVNSALKTGNYFDLKRNEKALLCLSPKYIAGKMMIVRAFVLGLDLILVEPSGHPLKNIIFDEIDFVAMVPLQVFNSFQNTAELEQLRRIKTTIIGGGAVSKTLFDFLQKEKNDYFATYGMTETITHIAVKKLNGNNASENFETLENVDLTIDSRGCLNIDAPDVSDEKVVTNDLVEIISSLQFQWLGRFDNIINSGGVKIIPEEIERKLNQFLTQRYFLSSQPDEMLGDRLILIIEGVSFSKNKMEQLNDFMKYNLMKYAIPKAIFFVEKFEETTSGKIQREKTKIVNSLL